MSKSKIAKKDVETIQRGSQLLKECACRLGMENKQFRDLLFSGKLHLNGEVSPQDKQFIEESIPEIKAVKKVEGRVLQGLAGLIYKFAAFAYRKVNSPMVDLDDFLQDARYAVSEALFGYSDSSKSKFITYVSNCIQHRLATSVNKCNPFCPLTNEALALLRMVEETKQSLNHPASEDEIFEILQLTPKQQAVVRDASTTIVDGNYLSLQPGRYNDYTGHRRGIDQETDTVPVYYELHEAIERAKLTPVEKHVINAFSDGYYGWQEDVASQHINPKTGKRYTRANIPFILKRAFEKIEQEYK